MSVSRWFITGVLASTVVWGPIPAQAQNQARILSVDHHEQADSAAASYSLMKPRLPKFMDSAAAASIDVFEVRWRPPSAGLPAGGLLTFEYRQELSDRVRFLSIRYPFRVQEERKGVFEITRAACKAHGRVTTWRARVVQGGRVLAEQRSKSWR
jgi:hypothetical protein